MIGNESQSLDILCILNLNYALCFSFANFQGDLAKRINSAKTGSGLNEYVTALFDASLSWDDVKWLKRYLHIHRL